ncbi:ABC transporter substrate-binding protein [Paracoccus aminophilus]|uniref:ABC-type dipeptide transport system, extracellular solute-binding protein n=1 Tax=Paracoccus aminophilus JCM 7686 TaxID=1367847 RepID=S5XTL4_PARAH|nr:ABC transporter substrate-binding protein [Paracoccus aminophilus]AGT10854.1 ABC-type dipeptide transport system, extracellular solute-binding protein [Paracoccus aminophilus JCM 7686]
MLTRRQFGSLIALTSLSVSLPQFLAAAPAPQAITFAIESEPTTLNPHLNGQAKARVVLRNLYDSLLARDEKGGYLPWLAQSYEASADGLTFDFHLRPGVNFHNGEALDAAALVVNFEHLRDPAYAANLAAGPASHLVKAEAIAPLHLRLTLAKPYAPFLGFAAGVDILAPSAYRSEQLKSGGPEVAGSGPFLIDTIAKGQEIRLRRNPDYAWAPANAEHQGPAYLEAVTFRILPESAVRVGALQSGQVDAIEGISGNDVALFRDDEGFSYISAFNTGTPYTLFLNSQSGPTAEQAVRKALRAAIDIPAVLQSIYRGERQRAWGISSPIEADLYDPAIENAWAFDPAEANRLLDEAGWTERDAAGLRAKNGTPLVIRIVQAQATVRDQRDVLLLALQAQARQNAGIQLELDYVDAGSYAERRKLGDYGSIPNSRTPADDGIDIEYHYLPLDEGGSVNYARVADPQVKAWLTQAAATSDLAARHALYAKVQDFVLREQGYALPIYVPEDQIAARADLTGLRFRPYFQQPDSLHGVRFDSEVAG